MRMRKWWPGFAGLLVGLAVSAAAQMTPQQAAMQQQQWNNQQQQLWGQLQMDRQRAEADALAAAAQAEAQKRREAIENDPRNFRSMLGALAMDLEGTAYATHIEPIDLQAQDQFIHSVAPKAVALCEKRHPGGGCRLVTEFNDGCVWIYWNRRLQESFWAKSYGRVAKVRAQQWCELNGDEGQCREVDWQCAVGKGGDALLEAADFSSVIPDRDEQAARASRNQPPVYAAIAIDRNRRTLSMSERQRTPMQAIQMVLHGQEEGSDPWVVTRHHDTCPGLAIARTTKERNDPLSDRNVFVTFAPTGVQAHNDALNQCNAANGGAGQCMVWTSYRDRNWCSGVDLD